ncbi:hypothetical protein ACFLRI_03070 [Bacteroidota bacterium]
MKSTWKKLHKTLKIGLIIFILGSGPLLVLIGLDAIGLVEAGNAVGFGILAMLSFYPSLILIIIGSILTYRKRKKEKKTLLNVV